MDQQNFSARKPGATFALGDVLFADFETIGRVPIDAGTDRYSRNASAVALAWAIGDGPVQVWAVDQFITPLNWRDSPPEMRRFFQRVYDGEAVICAHHAAFDRAIWQHATDRFPETEPWMWIDTKVQAMASGLPAALKDAVRFAGGLNLKDNAGKALISLFSLPGSTATPQSHPREWEEFLLYARRDISAMRELFTLTRQLPLSEWEEYWAAEVINDRGICVDLQLATAAAAMAKEDQKLSARELFHLTNGKVETVNQTKRIVAWLDTVLPADGRAMLVEVDEVVDPDTKEITTPGKDSLERDRVVRLIAYLESLQPLPPALSVALRVLQIREFGGSKTPAKFGRMLEQHVDGVLRGQYVFGGASQTGRFSSKGVQVHNLNRGSLAYEIDAIDALVGGIKSGNFAALGDDTPISRKLSLLIRPTLIPEPGNVFCWGDWANIEARLVPWLADDREADKRLDIFRAVDADPSIPDIYTRTAAKLSGIPLAAVDKDIRQRGKVVELACGFGGGPNALLSMAASYGVHLDREVAKEFVYQWRDDNSWAVRFWGRHEEGESYGLWGALNKAMENPRKWFKAGRVGYLYLNGYLGGSLMCRLPSGRWLTYRRIKYELIDVKNDKGEVVDVRRELMFARDMGRVKLWPGLACENVVQATAADIMRGTLVRLDEPAWYFMPVRLHTHDEVLAETKEKLALSTSEHLQAMMEKGFDWSTGLPIAADTVCGRWYSKSKGSLGL